MISTFAIVIAGVSFVIVAITAYRNVGGNAPVPVSTLNPQDVVVIVQSGELL